MNGQVFHNLHFTAQVNCAEIDKEDSAESALGLLISRILLSIKALLTRAKIEKLMDLITLFRKKSEKIRIV